MKKLFVLFIFSLFLFSCEKEINEELKKEEKSVVDSTISKTVTTVDVIDGEVVSKPGDYLSKFKMMKVDENGMVFINGEKVYVYDYLIELEKSNSNLKSTSTSDVSNEYKTYVKPLIFGENNEYLNIMSITFKTIKVVYRKYYYTDIDTFYVDYYTSDDLNASNDTNIHNVKIDTLYLTNNGDEISDDEVIRNEVVFDEFQYQFNEKDYQKTFDTILEYTFSVNENDEIIDTVSVDTTYSDTIINKLNNIYFNDFISENPNYANDIMRWVINSENTNGQYNIDSLDQAIDIKYNGNILKFKIKILSFEETGLLFDAVILNENYDIKDTVVFINLNKYKEINPEIKNDFGDTKSYKDYFNMAWDNNFIDITNILAPDISDAPVDLINKADYYMDPIKLDGKSQPRD